MQAHPQPENSGPARTQRIAHDLNNSLMHILGFVELLALEAPRTARTDQFMTEVRSGIERARALTQELHGLK